MASKITKQQRDDLNASHGQPVPVEDDTSSQKTTRMRHDLSLMR
jgi:hypothetical protein